MSDGRTVPTQPGESPRGLTGARTFRPDELVAGRYRIVRFIGEGGMAEVYEAVDEELHQRVALKVLHPDLAQEPRAADRLRREVLLARRVTHPNVCRVYDLGHAMGGATESDQGVVFLTMEFLEGETLAQRLDRLGPLSPQDALPLIRQVAAGLEAAHAQGVLHRDLKPSNVLLVGTDDQPLSLKAVLTDFGLARSTGPLDVHSPSVSTAVLAGTPEYMAPEQIETGEASSASDTLRGIHASIGADLVVLGSYVAVAGGLSGGVRIDVRVQDAVNGETTAVGTRTGPDSELLALVSGLGADLRRQLGSPSLDAPRTAALMSSLPSKTGTLQYYSQGVERLRFFDALAARDQLEKAIQIEPEYPFAHVALSETWLALGYDVRSRHEAQLAYQMSERLSTEDRLVIEARYRERAKEWEKAVEIYAAIWHEFPDSVDYGLRLATAQVVSGRHKDALATLASLRKLPGPLGGDPRIDLAEAAAAKSVGDLHSQRSAAKTAAENALRVGARLVAAQGRMLEGEALRDLGDHEAAGDSFASAQAGYAEVGDRAGELRALVNLAVVHQYRGNLADAAENYLKARKLFLALGDRKGEAWALNNLAVLLRIQGSWQESRRTFEEATSIYREIEDDEGAASALNNMAIVIWQLGDREAAKKMARDAIATRRTSEISRGAAQARSNLAFMLWQEDDRETALGLYREALAISTKAGDKLRAAEALINLGVLHLQLGNLDEAAKSLSGAIAYSRESGNKNIEGHALQAQGDVLLDQGDLIGTRQKLEEAARIRESLRLALPRAMSLLSMASLLVEEGRPSDAATAAEQAAGIFRSEKVLDREVAALDVLARAHLGAGDLDKAKTAIDRTLPLLESCGEAGVRIRVSLTVARVRAGEGNLTQAGQVLQAALADATRSRLRGLHLEARLAQAEIGLLSGKGAAARTSLETVESDARACGFGRIAKRAVALRESYGMPPTRER
ncbi:MAG: tetratricopeptide repeat protein [Acidobacteria bacterium]|nr:tetratricopeptide repeat protein [Acidobacteriota bacterium]